MRILALLALLLVGATPAPLLTPLPAASSLPVIYHSVSRPLCSALASTIRPAVAMMIQSDRTIAKSPAFFKDYIDLTAAGSSAGQDMAVMHLEILVPSLVQNTLAIQKLLENTSIFPDDPQNTEGKALNTIRAQMLQALSDQQAAIDIIYGFVDTQQLGEMQHEGFGYLASITGTGTPQQQQINSLDNNNPMATPDPLERPQTFDNLALQAGLKPNQYEFDPTQIPGLAVGYNPIGKLKEGLEWTQVRSKKDEEPLSKSVVIASNYCAALHSPATPSPKP